MPTFLLTVGDVSDIAGTCVIPTPGLAPTVRGLRDGLPIELRRPDGTILQTQIYSVVLVGPDDPKRLTHITMRGISQRDIPVGTEIWLKDVVRILSLGDDSTILRGFQCVLEKAGYASWVTTDEQEALSILHTQSIDLFIQDWVRAGPGATALLRRMKTDETLRGIPVLVISASPRDESAKALTDAGLDMDHDLDGYLVKGELSIDQILGTVKSILTKHGKS